MANAFASIFSAEMNIPRHRSSDARGYAFVLYESDVAAKGGLSLGTIEVAGGTETVEQAMDTNDGKKGSRVCPKGRKWRDKEGGAAGMASVDG